MRLARCCAAGALVVETTGQPSSSMRRVRVEALLAAEVPGTFEVGAASSAKAPLPDASHLICEFVGPVPEISTAAAAALVAAWRSRGRMLTDEEARSVVHAHGTEEGDA